MTPHSSNNMEALSPGGILMIIIAAIGLFSAFTMIICLLALSRRRVRTENQIETLNRALTPNCFRPFPPTFDSMHTQIRVRSLFGPYPSMDPKFEFRPPSYDEAMRMATSNGRAQPVASNTLDLPQSNQRGRSPPPAFSEMDPLPRSSMSAPACNELFSRQSNLPTNINVEHSTNIATISDRYSTFPTHQPCITSNTQPTHTL